MWQNVILRIPGSGTISTSSGYLLTPRAPGHLKEYFRALSCGPAIESSSKRFLVIQIRTTPRHGGHGTRLHQETAIPRKGEPLLVARGSGAAALFRVLPKSHGLHTKRTQLIPAVCLCSFVLFEISSPHGRGTKRTAVTRSHRPAVNWAFGCPGMTWQISCRDRMPVIRRNLPERVIQEDMRWHDADQQ